MGKHASSEQRRGVRRRGQERHAEAHRSPETDARRMTRVLGTPLAVPTRADASWPQWRRTPVPRPARHRHGGRSRRGNGSTAHRARRRRRRHSGRFGCAVQADRDGRRNVLQLGPDAERHRDRVLLRQLRQERACARHGCPGGARTRRLTAAKGVEAAALCGWGDRASHAC